MTGKGCKSLSILDYIGRKGDLYIYIFESARTMVRIMFYGLRSKMLTKAQILPLLHPRHLPRHLLQTGSSTSSVQIKSFILTLFLLRLGRLIQYKNRKKESCNFP